MMMMMYLNLMTFLSGTLPCRHAAILSNFTKEIAHTSPELYFSQSMLLMYGTNCQSKLILAYHYSCKICKAWIYHIICFCKSSILFICRATFSGFCASKYLQIWAALSTHRCKLMLHGLAAVGSDAAMQQSTEYRRKER